MTPPKIPFAMQRLVFLALVFGVLAFMGVIALLHSSGGPPIVAAPIPELDLVCMGFGAGSTVAALALRGLLHRRADALPPDARGVARFRAHLVPLAILEGGSLLALVTWMVNGHPLPGLVVALVLLSVMIMIIPFRDPEATTGD